MKKEELEMIEKTMTIGKLLEENPDKADILLEAGMHCLGCLVAQDETIEEACEVHGIDVDELVKELNKQAIRGGRAQKQREQNETKQL